MSFFNFSQSVIKKRVGRDGCHFWLNLAQLSAPSKEEQKHEQNPDQRQVHEKMITLIFFSSDPLFSQIIAQKNTTFKILLLEAARSGAG